MSLGGLLAVAFIALSAVPVAAADFPAKDSRYHSYTEMVADIHAVEAAHPDIVDVFSIGKSYQGRDLWAAKISDNVATDESEPEILFDALHHAREHMTVEQALYLLHLLADNYATDSQIAGLVNGREIWIVFAVNPDGFEYDLTCTGSSHPPYCAWRKNRQPNAGTTAIGTDLNRNYRLPLGVLRRIVGQPVLDPLPRPRRVLRARDPGLPGLRPQPGRRRHPADRAHITFHTNGELILWPYGYTKTDIPADMTSADHAAFVAMGRAMAARNGYTAEQSSDLYITDGDQIDWLYGSSGSSRSPGSCIRRRPRPSGATTTRRTRTSRRQTARNRKALLYFLTVASCPYRTIGRRAQTAARSSTTSRWPGAGT